VAQWHYNQGMSALSKQPKWQEEAPLPDPTAGLADDTIDVSMLRANLALSPAERLRRHQVALDRMRKLQEARFL
jgi:hypothetical protein